MLVLRTGILQTIPLYSRISKPRNHLSPSPRPLLLPLSFSASSSAPAVPPRYRLPRKDMSAAIRERSIYSPQSFVR